MGHRPGVLARGFLLWTCALPLWLCGCLEATPFGVNPSEENLTRKNLDELASREPRTPLKFIAIGDIHNALDGLARTVEVINARDDIAFVAVAGDISDRGLLQEFEWVRELLEGLDVPYLTAVGNHDALSSGKDVYRRMFGPFDYHFRYGGVEFVFYNSNTLEFPGEPVPNLAWIQERVAAAGDAEGIVLVTHQPLFPPPESATSLSGEGVDSLLRGRVSLSVHSHLAEDRVWLRRNTPILQCGTFEKNYGYTVVTVERRAIVLDHCRFEDCAQVFRGGQVGVQ